MKTMCSHFGRILIATCSVVGLAVAAEPDSPIPTTVIPATADSSAVVKSAVGTLPSDFKPSAKLDEIIRLAQAGVSEEVLLAYVNKAQRDFSPSPEEIIFLHDLGVTDTVITALIKSKPGETAKAQAPASPAPPAATSGVPISTAPPALNGVVAQPAPAEGTTAVVIQQPAQQVTVNYFYEELQPYGNWVQLSDYGWCWQPTVVVANPRWRPYGDRGRWLWTTSGWYWQSDYSWGWAPFHYGRWHCHPRYSWVWVPETTWGPSWVSWRYSSDYCGWAPLPPAARFSPGIGFTYFGGHVGVGFEFGLSFGHYTYVPANRFCERNPWTHRVSGSQINVLHQRTTVVNNYIVNNKTVINQGAGHDKIARAVAKPIPTITVRDMPEHSRGHGRGDRITTEGSQQVVYRSPLTRPEPTPKASPIRATSESQTATRSTPPHSGRTPTVSRQNLTTTTTPALPERSTTPYQLNRPSLIEQRTSQPSRSSPAPSSPQVRVNPNTEPRSGEKTLHPSGNRGREANPTNPNVRQPTPATPASPATPATPARPTMPARPGTSTASATLPTFAPSTPSTASTPLARPATPAGPASISVPARVSTPATVSVPARVSAPAPASVPARVSSPAPISVPAPAAAPAVPPQTAMKHQRGAERSANPPATAPQYRQNVPQPATGASQQQFQGPTRTPQPSSPSYRPAPTTPARSTPPPSNNNNASRGDSNQSPGQSGRNRDR